MGGYIKPIGGEHWFDIELFDNNLENFKDTNAVFLRGGQSAIRFILEDIDVQSNEYVLMPSYLCPSILNNFKKLEVKYEFYRINKDLSIDIKDIKNKIEKLNVKAVFFIDYFGFYHNRETLEYLKKLQNEKIIIIEDAVQMLWFNRRKFIGDYTFNSYRKFLPIDGSIVLCKNLKTFSFTQDDYYNNINLGRIKKTAFHNFHIGKEEDFLELYEKSEKEYYDTDQIIGMDSESKRMLSKINYNNIRATRKRNYNYLFNKLINNNKIRIIFDKKLIGENIILGLPIFIENRDEIRDKLRKINIYCPVHWGILGEKWSEKYVDSRYVSENIITLPIDQRYDTNDMDRLVININNLLRG